MSIVQSSRYPEALRALHAVLAHCGEAHWANWVEKDLHAWGRSRSFAHHLAAYGGMGSLNDVVLTRERCRAQSVETQVWVDALFEELKSVSHLLAEFQRRRLTFFETARLKANLPPVNRKLQGWKCGICGHAEISPIEVEKYVARAELRTAVMDALARGLLALVSEVLSGKLPAGVEPKREWIFRSIENVGVALQPRSEWMRPCPRCGSEDTAIAYWSVDDRTHSLVPA